MKQSTKTYNCKHCNNEAKWSHQKYNVYCSTACSAAGMFTETINKFNRGEISERATIRKVLTQVRGYQCEVCNISDWQGEPITLQVDHIDGNSGNDMPLNVRLICPNCHSQTKTFGARNKGNGRKARGLALR